MEQKDLQPQLKNNLINLLYILILITQKFIFGESSFIKPLNITYF